MSEGTPIPRSAPRGVRPRHVTEPEVPVNELKKYQWETLVVGAILTTLAMAIFAIIAGVYVNWIASWAVAGAVALISYQFGAKLVPVQFGGVPQILGRRLDGVYFTEGWVWVIPFLMDVIPVDMRDRALDIEGKEALVPTEDGSVETDFTLVWRVDHPHQFLSVTEEVVKEGLVAATMGTVREFARDKSMEDVRGVSEEEIVVKTRDENGNDEMRTVMDAIDAHTNAWGIEVPTVFLEDIKLDPKVDEAYQKRSIEEQERTAERTELGHVREQIKLTAVTLVEQGMDPAEAARHAQLIVQSERGKGVTRREVIISGGTGDPIRDAAGTIVGGREGKE